MSEATGKWPRYPAYRHSAADWLGDVPAHWALDRLQDHTQLVSGYPFDSDLFSRTSGTPLIRIRDLLAGSTETYYAGEPIGEAEVTDDDILIGMDGDYNLAWWHGGRALLNQRLCCLRPAPSLNKRFLYYFLTFPLKIINDLTWFTTVKHLSASEVLKIRITIPPVDEQAAIARFLDRETAKIDALVGKKERLIELLEERRAALINRAVTKGLTRAVVLKDSGVEYLGQGPVDWEVRRLMYLTETHRPIMYGIVLPGPHVEDGVPIVKGGDVSPDKLRLELLRRTSREIEAGYVRSRLRGGDIVYAIRGSIGMAEVIPPELEGANLTQDAARVAPKSEADGRWLLFALKSAAVFAQLDAGAIGATIRGINIRDLKRAVLPVPPRDEQLQIVHFLESETGTIDRLTALIREHIEKLSEYRRALISAAVTGKIDVRGEVPV